MKFTGTFLITAVILFGSTANAQSTEDLDVLLGAAAGAALGSTIGDGDGRKIATVVGGLIGANMARDRHGYRYVGQRFQSYCKDRVPAEYRNNLGVARSWVEGCVARLEQRQAELEQQAFEEALNGPSN
jgi:predicted nucleotidyltransferase